MKFGIDFPSRRICSDRQRSGGDVENHDLTECKDRHFLLHKEIWDRLELFGEVDVHQNEYRRMGPGHPATPEEIAIARERLRDVTCRVCDRSYGEHSEEEFLACLKKLIRSA
jgi:hypothetical protein